MIPFIEKHYYSRPGCPVCFSLVYWLHPLEIILCCLLRVLFAVLAVDDSAEV
jgi:hypothetical protein